jgi:hypothetical protein
LFDNLGDAAPKLEQVQAIEALGVPALGTSLHSDPVGTTSQLDEVNEMRKVVKRQANCLMEREAGGG